MTAGTSNAFVYCKMLVHVMVGNIKSLLLIIVHRKSDVRRPNDSVEHVTVNPVQYMPLQKKCFNRNIIQLLTDFGEPLLFVDGKSFVVFRWMVYPYLLL